MSAARPLRRRSRRFAAATAMFGFASVFALLAGCVTQPAAPPTPPAVVVPDTEPDAEVALAPPPALVAVPPPPVLVRPRESATDVATRELLALNDRARTLSSADIGREVSARGGDPASQPRQAIEVAILLMAAKANGYGNGDTGRALALLDVVIRLSDPQAAPLQPLARLLQSRVLDQRRMEETIERQAAQLRDNQRRLEQASGQIEALKSIERSLNSRVGGTKP